MTRLYGLMVVILFYSCDSQKKRIEEISFLSQIDIPINTEILNYHDNLETAIVYKMRLDKNKLENFVKDNKFGVLDTLNKDYIVYHDILNSFVNKEKIWGKNLKICHEYSTVIILNEEEFVFWGITRYPVNLPDSILKKAVEPPFPLVYD